MVLFDFSRNRIVIFIILITILAGIILGIIFYANSTLKSNQQPSSSLVDYAPLLQEVNLLSSDSSIAQNSQYQRFLEKFQKLGDSKLSRKQKYDELANSVSFFEGLYSSTNNPKVYPVLKNIDKFAKDSFPDFYQELDFSYFCQDPSCAETSQPEEIENIIKDIESSDFPDFVKKSLIRDVTNVGYLSKSQNEEKALTYLTIEDIIRNYGNYSPSGVNLKIADRLYAYIEKEFPEILQKMKEEKQ